MDKKLNLLIVGCLLIVFLIASGASMLHAATINRNAGGNIEKVWDSDGTLHSTMLRTTNPGSDIKFWGSGMVREETRGIAEFNLTEISPIPNSKVELVLGDGGGYTLGDSTTNIYYYIGDGEFLEEDWDSGGTFFTSITREYLGDDTFLDITDIVNSFESQYLGFRFEALNAFSQQQGDSFSPIHISYNPVPIPSTILLFCSGFISLMGVRKKFRTA